MLMLEMSLELAQRSMLSHMFSFMRQAKKMHKQGNVSGGGIYLDDLNLDDLDPELAALYFPSSSFRHGSATANVAIRFANSFILCLLVVIVYLITCFVCFFLLKKGAGRRFRVGQRSVSSSITSQYIHCRYSWF